MMRRESWPFSVLLMSPEGLLLAVAPVTVPQKQNAVEKVPKSAVSHSDFQSYSTLLFLCPKLLLQH